jgi:hypothetical protein
VEAQHPVPAKLVKFSNRPILVGLQVLKMLCRFEGSVLQAMQLESHETWPGKYTIGCDRLLTVAVACVEWPEPHLREPPQRFHAPDQEVIDQGPIDQSNTPLSFCRAAIGMPVNASPRESRQPRG